MRISSSLTALCAVCLLLPCTGSTAQFAGSGTQTSSCSVAIDGLPHVPELHTDMPLDCLIGYIAMDSAARTGSIPELLRVPPSLSLAHLRVPARYIYAMKDYDPILLHRHFRSTMDSAYPNERYKAYPANVVYPVLMELYKRQEEFGRDLGLLIVSDYILHVRIDEARSGIDSTFYPSTQEWTNVACRVVETFKGKRLPGNCRFTASHKQTEEQTLASDCLVYGHLTMGQYIPKPGDEFIIFLTLRPLVEGVYMVYPNFDFGRHGGRFRIVDGRVQDPDNVFGLGVAPSVEDFKTNIRRHIDDIRNWTF